MKIALIVIGDEILLGRTREANGAWAAGYLQKLGYGMETMVTIKDEESVIKENLEKMTSLHDLVLVSGGLGPTRDDKTKSALASWLGVTLTASREAEELVTKHYENFGRKWTTDTNHYHFLPEGIEPLFNYCGLAPGLLYPAKQGSWVCALPGVPREFREMISGHMPEIFKRMGRPASEARRNVTIRTRGVPEEEIFFKLCPDLWDELEKHGSPSSLPGKMGIDIVIKDVSATIEETLKAIMESKAFAPLINHVWNTNDQGPLELLVELLKEKNLTLGTAESCTGGLMASMITDMAGSSSYYFGSVVSYDNSIKQNILGVPRDMIEKQGAVSEEVVTSMARGLIEKFNVDVALSTSGIAGPDGGTEEKPVGTVTFGCAISWKGKIHTTATTTRFRGDRALLKERFALGCFLNALEKIRSIVN